MSQWIHHLEQWLLEFGVIGLVIVSFTESSFSRFHLMCY